MLILCLWAILLQDVFRALSETSASGDAWQVVPSLGHTTKVVVLI